MDPKTLFAGLSVLVGCIAFVPYVRSIFAGKTKPHEFTWFLLLVIQGTSVTILWSEGGGLGGLYLALGPLLVLFVFLLSLRNGARDITRSDKVILFLVIVALGLWIILKDPLISAVLLSAMDVSSYIPTFRKSYRHPWLESVWIWGGFALADFLSLLAVESYSFLTSVYLVSITSVNAVLCVYLVVRRRKINRVD